MKQSSIINHQSSISCHWISNTHWDREWRFSMQKVRYNLVDMMDTLLDIFEQDPEYKHFHLDSQTIPLEDYLEIRPEKEERIRELVQDGKLAVGPWFCLPDEYCVAGESLVRNLLLGHKIAKRFGGVSKTGYSPFSWGQISQMPQLYKGFGIDMISFYRGINTLVCPKSEAWWEAPDGTRIAVSRLAPRPRYNAYYLINRPVLWGQKDPDNRMFNLSEIEGSFRFMNMEHELLDGRHIYPVQDYDNSDLDGYVDRTVSEQDGHWSTPHRFWSEGHDSSFPNMAESKMIADCNRSLGEEGDVFHSSVKAWQDGVIANASDDWPVLSGEMHHTASPGSSSELIGYIISARTYLKQDNFNTERKLTGYAEPMAVFASMLGAPWPQSFIDTAYNWLLQNHGHDSIAGCSRDIVHDDMQYRYRQSREISDCVAERAMMDIAGSIDLSGWSPDTRMAAVVFNPSAFARTETMQVVVDVPAEWDSDGFRIVDEAGDALLCQIVAEKGLRHHLYLNHYDMANTAAGHRYTALVEFPDVPGMGYKTFAVERVEKVGKKQKTLTNPVSMVTGPQQMENELVRVKINANGTLDILDKATGRLHEGLGWFRDSSEVGDPWFHAAVESDTIFTTLNERASVTLVRDGELEASFKVAIDWALPVGAKADEKFRRAETRPYRIVNTLTLRKGQPWVEIASEIDNSVEDHYLQVCFSSGIDSDKVMAQGQFDVVERSVIKPDYNLYYETPQPEQPMNSFVDISDGEAGMALLNEGLKAYTANDDADRTLSISLLRCFPLKICATEEGVADYRSVEKGSQCPGKNSFRYAVMPHAGDWASANLWQAAERFNMEFTVCQVGATSHGTEPTEKSFLEIEPSMLHVSAVKRSESGEGWVVRLFNPLDETVEGKIRLNGGCTGPDPEVSPLERMQNKFGLPEGKGGAWSTVRETTLEEVPVRDLELDADGWIEVSISKKKITTMEFL
ncbi:MAG: glycoside hydrolase family 38 C-terminal domain-containing protein [Verrucomicrobiota bacterium]